MSDFYDRNPSAQPFRGRLVEMRSQEQLLRNAFFHMKRWRTWRGRWLWTLVAAITGHGSGYSQQICEELGWDYAMPITPTAELPPRRA